MGGIIEDVPNKYPEAWEYLQTESGQKLCKTEAEWQEMSTTIYYTNIDNTSEGWNGIGGVPFYAPDFMNGSLRLPDVRGMYAESAGFNFLNVGDVGHDKIRNFRGNLIAHQWIFYYVDGVFQYNNIERGNTASSSSTTNTTGSYSISINPSRTIPTGNVNTPRHYGVLTCVYLGQSIK